MTLIAHQCDILQKVESESESIARPIFDIVGSVQFQDIIRQRLEQLGRMAETVGDHIQAIDAMLEDRRDDMNEEALPQKLDNMFNNYGMAGQREIHMAAHGRAESLRRGR
jgi:methyl-accepting chemotaxis protein